MIKANFATVNEELAKTAKELNSHWDYIEGTVTKTQNELVSQLVDYANELIEKYPNLEPEKIQLVQDLCDRYSVKLATAIDRENSIRSRCPSIMICGAGNFPIRKKEKQNEAIKKFYEECDGLFALDDNNYYYNKIGNTICNTSIYSDDKNAVQKIKDKITTLETMPDPYGNKKAEIRRLKERLLTLSPEEVKAGKQIKINGVEATFNNIVSIFNEFAPKASKYGEEINYYITIPLIFNDGTRKYTTMLQLTTDEKCETYRTYGNSENNYKYIWQPLTALEKFHAIIGEISGSGNKAVIYSILKDLEPQTAQEEKQKNFEEIQENSKINGEPITVDLNKEQQRLQIFFEGIPTVETRQKMKANGFKWSPSNKAWQRLLNDNSINAFKKIVDKE